MKFDNPFRIVFDRFYEYFTVKTVRKFLFFAILSSVFFALCVRFKSGERIFLCMLILSLAAVSFTSLIDSVQEKRAFISQIHNIESDYIARMKASELDRAFKRIKLQGCVFSAEEAAYIRKKKREYNSAIAVKVFFVIIFVVLFANIL